MAMLYKLNGSIIDINAEREINGTVYPRTVLLARRDQWASLGVTEEAEPSPAPPTAAEIAAQFASYKLAKQNQIDAERDATYLEAVGQLATEYRDAEADARAYKAGGYAGVAGAYVHNVAVKLGVTDQQYTDLIIARADTFLAAQLALRVSRIPAKAVIGAATDIAAADTAFTQWRTELNAIRAQLGLPSLAG